MALNCRAIDTILRGGVSGTVTILMTDTILRGGVGCV